MYTVDFETEGITGNTSHAPPRPVGVSIKKGNGKSRYYAWGHPTENNSTEPKATAALAKIWKGPLLFHNAKFDVSVAMHWLGLPMPEARRIHDTVPMLFLLDPYSPKLSLKPSAERLLDWPPDEQDKLTDWIIANTECRGRQQAGGWISHAPGGLVGEYAKGDTDRTKALYDFLAPKIKDRGMWGAYELEQDLMPITYYSEKKGVRVDRGKLTHDLEGFEKALAAVEQRLRRTIKCKDLEFDNANDVADALERAGLVSPDDWVLTKTGQRSTSKENFPKAIKNKALLKNLRYRGALAQCLSTFARPWLELSEGDGRLHTTWNQVRTHGSTGSSSQGARTGRLSASKPSLMNVPNEYGIDLPRGLPVPPLMRRYLLPEEGHVWLKRDFSGQELRILAHFEDGALLKAYQENPELDPHEMARKMIKGFTGTLYSRKAVKITAFSIVYGSGVNALAQLLGTPLDEAVAVKDAYLRAFPGVRSLQKLTMARGRTKQSIRTWGGREYYTEPGKIVKGRMLDFSYKLLNYLIQGSAADQTKDRICAWWDHHPKEDVFLATVHDEINISAPTDTWKASMHNLQEVMDADLFDCPMRSEGFVGANWLDL